MKIYLTSFLILSALLMTACSNSETPPETLSQEEEENTCRNTYVMYSGKDEIEGWIDFESYEGISKEEINIALKELKLPEFEVTYLPYSLEPIQGVRGIVLEERRENAPSEEDYLKLLEENNYVDAEVHSMDKLGVAIYFSYPLTAQEQNDFSTELVAMGLNEDKLTWFEWPPSRWGSVRVPVDEEAEYIKTLQALNLFECVGERVQAQISLPSM